MRHSIRLRCVRLVRGRCVSGVQGERVLPEVLALPSRVLRRGRAAAREMEALVNTLFIVLAALAVLFFVGWEVSQSVSRCLR